MKLLRKLAHARGKCRPRTRIIGIVGTQRLRRVAQILTQDDVPPVRRQRNGARLTGRELQAQLGKPQRFHHLGVERADEMGDRGKPEAGRDLIGTAHASQPGLRLENNHALARLCEQGAAHKPVDATTNDDDVIVLSRNGVSH